MATDEELEAIRRAARESRERASALLDEELETVMTEVNRLDELKPDVADQETYDQVAAVVREASARNHSIATLRRNLENLGTGALELVRNLAGAAGRFS